MFTGIIHGCYPVVALEKKQGLTTFAVEFPDDYLGGLNIGASVAVNGTCLTVTKIEQGWVWFDAMEETLNKTNLGMLEMNDGVNVERSAKFGDEIGGHVMSGHIIDTAEITRIDQPENNYVVTFRVRPDLMKYIFDKGFIGLDGASLTIVNPDKRVGTFEVWLIPETLRLTAYKHRKVGDRINVEIDSRTQVIVDTVETILDQKHEGTR